MQERKNRWSRIEDLTGFNLQQPADMSALMTALGYEKTRCRPGGEDSNSGVRLFDLSTDFSLFTGEDFVEEQPSMCLRSSEGAYNRPSSEWQSKNMLQSLTNRFRTEASPSTGTHDYHPTSKSIIIFLTYMAVLDPQYFHPDPRTEQNTTNLVIQPNISRNYSFVRPFATLWRRKVKSHQQPGCYSPQIRPQLALDSGQSTMNYDGYHRKPSIS